MHDSSYVSNNCRRKTLPIRVATGEKEFDTEKIIPQIKKIIRDNSPPKKKDSKVRFEEDLSPGDDSE